MNETPQSDPAAARFALLQLVRLGGALLALTGALVAAGKATWLAGAPQELGYGLLAGGIAAFFGAPPLLARRWKSRDQG